MVLSAQDIEGTAHVSRGDWSIGIYFEVMNLEEKDGERKFCHSWRSYTRRGGCWDLKKNWDCQQRQRQPPVWPFLHDQWGIFSECCILLFIFLELPPPSGALLPPLLFSVSNYFPREKTQEQQGDSIWCIVGSSVVHMKLV